MGAIPGSKIVEIESVFRELKNGDRLLKEAEEVMNELAQGLRTPDDVIAFLKGLESSSSEFLTSRHKDLDTSPMAKLRSNAERKIKQGQI